MAVDYSALKKIIHEMDTQVDSRPLQPIDKRETARGTLRDGVKINRGDFDAISTNIEMFSHEGEHALLFIDKPKKTEAQLIAEPAIEAQRFHLVKNCSTLTEMHNKGRSYRYVLIQNSKGIFPSHPIDPITNKTLENIKIDAYLLPCKNCLQELNYNGYQGGFQLDEKQHAIDKNIFLNFCTKEFFNHYEPFFYTYYYRKNISKDKAGDSYTIDHAKKRDDLLKQKQFTCDECKVELKNRPKLLHLFHKNGKLKDNKSSNLSILCKQCFRDQPMYKDLKMTITPEEATIISMRKPINKN